ncbi:MAG: hypothetical protein ABIC95_02215 [archaeon]
MKGLFEKVIERCLDSDIIKVGALLLKKESITNEYKKISEVTLDNQTYAVRKYDLVHQENTFSSYSLHPIQDTIEKDMIAYGFGATQWVSEKDVAIIDGSWGTNEGDIRSRTLLFRAMEHDMAKNNSIIRACSEVNKPDETQFFLDMGYRKLVRNDKSYPNPKLYFFEGRKELYKVAHPAFDPKLIDNPKI